jgi:predicted metal-dependent HD superfamily phosphohydrolase
VGRDESLHGLDRRVRLAYVADPGEVCGDVHDAMLRPQHRLRSSRCNTGDVAEHLTEELREDLLARWSETHRKHHTVTHLHEMLDAIGMLAESGVEFDREAVELAAWFHDAIYEIGRDDNEDRSAELARELLASSPIRDEVARLVLVTKTHKVTDDDVNGAVLCDADLSVLGSDAFRYRAYAAAVREEYAEIPDEVFKPARAKVLASLLEGQLFQTAQGRERWEQLARRNIAEEIAALTS